MVFPKRLDVRVGDLGEGRGRLCARLRRGLRARRTADERLRPRGPGRARSPCGGTGASLVLVEPRYRYAAMGVGLAAAVGLLLGEVWGEDALRPVHLAAGGAGPGADPGRHGAGRHRSDLPARSRRRSRSPRSPSCPLRLPIQIGGETNFLLIPALRRDRRRLPARALAVRSLGARTSCGPRARRDRDESPAVRYLVDRACRVARRLRAWHRVVGQPDERGSDCRVLPGSLCRDARAPSRRALASEARRSGPARVGARRARASRFSRYGST